MPKNNPCIVTASHSSDRNYVVTLLLASLDNLSRDLAVKKGLDPESIVSETLLKQSLELQYRGTDKMLVMLEASYGDLLDTLVKLINQ